MLSLIKFYGNYIIQHIIRKKDKITSSIPDLKASSFVFREDKFLWEMSQLQCHSSEGHSLNWYLLYLGQCQHVEQTLPKWPLRLGGFILEKVILEVFWSQPVWNFEDIFSTLDWACESVGNCHDYKYAFRIIQGKKSCCGLAFCTNCHF